MGGDGYCVGYVGGYLFWYCCCFGWFVDVLVWWLGGFVLGYFGCWFVDWYVVCFGVFVYCFWFVIYYGFVYVGVFLYCVDFFCFWVVFFVF